MVDIYNIIHNYYNFVESYTVQLYYIFFSLTFHKAAKLVELITSSSHTIATQSSIKLIKYAC